ncbi:MAG: DinB family protein [Proteobacteria bacterium]|nr:DinB family protein [Pseudomonadota bacterium]
MAAEPSTSGLVNHFVAMARNNAWANHRLLSACEALSPSEFAAPRTGFFPSLRATFNHILWVDQYYIDAVAGLDALRRYNEPGPDFADAHAMRLAQTVSDKRLIAVCERQTDATLAADCVLPRPNRRPPLSKTAAVLEHLFQHQIHHRGQAHAMLSGTAVKPPQLDEFFLAGEEALRRDELRALGLPET